MTMLPAGMVVSCRVTSSMLYRSWYCDGASYRSSSSNRDLAPVVAQRPPLVGVGREGDGGVADELCHRLGARAAEHHCERSNFEVGQFHDTAVAGDVDLREAAD